MVQDSEQKDEKRKRPKWPRVTRRKNGGGSISFCVDVGRINGRRLRKFFKTRPEADTYAEQQRTAKANQGTAAFSIDDKLRIDAIEARRLLQPYKVSLTEAAKYYVKHAKPDGGQKMMIELAKEVLEAKLKIGRRKGTVDTYRILYKKFNLTFGHRHVHEVHRSDIEEWLDANTQTLATRSARLDYLNVLFQFAVKRNYCATNPLEGVDRPQITLKPPEIFTVEQTISLLRAALDLPEFEMLPYVSIGLFAGLRPTEIIRLDWSNVMLDQRVILVNADASKTSQKRFVEISDNLLDWLRPVAKKSGPIIPRDLKRRIQMVCAKTADYDDGKIEKWPRDGMRHSYASYHLAKHQNAPQTSLQMGHMSPQMLFNHYRNLVLAADADRYWSITPGSVNR